MLEIQQMIILIVICSLISTIYSCSAGQYIDHTTDTCLTCSSNCISCINASSCSKCSSNYYIINNKCILCTDANCTCNGININCNNAVNIALMFAIVVGPICATFIFVFLGCFISKKCRAEASSTSAEPSNEGFLKYVEPKLNNLGILTTVMKKRWIQNNLQEGIDERQVCAICLGDKCEIKTICNHKYHSKCLSLWYKRKRSCPVCKRQKIASIHKFCMNCGKRYIEASLEHLNQFIAQFFNTCSSCKAQKNKRLDSLCEMDLNSFQ